jgi:hypothetical protein
MAGSLGCRVRSELNLSSSLAESFILTYRQHHTEVAGRWFELGINSAEYCVDRGTGE